jgi:hypothetical protein
MSKDEAIKQLESRFGEFPMVRWEETWDSRNDCVVISGVVTLDMTVLCVHSTPKEARKQIVEYLLSKMK